MEKWYHCSKCNYYWPSKDFQYQCPQCGADAFLLLKMDHNHAYRLKKFFELIEQDQQRYEQYKATKRQENSHVQETTPNNKFTPHLEDNRHKLEKLHNNGNGEIRNIIIKSIKEIKVNGNNGDLLKIQISDDSIIEIFNDKTGRIVLWNYLTDAERWSFWQQFDELLVRIKT